MNREQQVIENAAARYGIEVHWVLHGDEIPKTVTVLSAISVGCDVYNHAIYLGHHNTPAIFAYAIHELAHDVCAVPYIGIPSINEWCFQLQFERALCWSLFGESAVYESLIETVHGNAGTPVPEVYMGKGGRCHIGGKYDRAIRFNQLEPRLWKKRWWIEGWGRARRLGLLDLYDKPTFRRPDWSQLTLDELAAFSSS